MKNRKKQAGRLLCILLGDTLYSLSVQLFLRPGGLLTGGTTGISLAVEKMTGFPAATFMLLFNSLLFLLALWLLGREFALSTIQAPSSARPRSRCLKSCSTAWC